MLHPGPPLRSRNSSIWPGFLVLSGSMMVKVIPAEGLRTTMESMACSPTATYSLEYSSKPNPSM